MSKDINNCHVAILCGGKGTRLKPKTDQVPKALVELQGKPIVDHILEMYQSKGFNDFTFCVGYKGELIKEKYKDKSNVTINFSDAGEEASMLERIAKLTSKECDRFIVSYGDTFIDLDFKKMIAAHLERDASATILTAKIKNPFGLVNYDGDGWVQSFEEKPFFDYYIGCFVIERQVLANLKEGLIKQPDGKGLISLFLQLMKEKRLANYQYDGPQITFNTETERKIAEENLLDYYTLSE